MAKPIHPILVHFAIALIRDLRQTNGELLGEVRVLASKNEALRRQLAEALAVASCKNVTPIRRKPK